MNINVSPHINQLAPILNHKVNVRTTLTLYMQNKSFKNDSEAEKYIRQFDSRDKLNKTNTPYLLMTGLDPI